MIYGNELKKLLKEEKNIINRMYLNEILLQYRRLEEVFLQDPATENYYEEIAAAMSTFTNQLENPKYTYNKSGKIGFKKSSPVMSSSYIDDFIYSIFKRQRILRNKGITWGRQTFSMNMKLNPTNFFCIEKDVLFDFKESPNFLQLTQQIDIQFRVAGKKTFTKHTVTLPLLTFVIHKRLNPDDLIRVVYFAQKAKETFSKSKMVIVCETIDPTFTPDDLSTYLDIIFVLRKRKASRRNGIIHPDVLKALNDKVEEYLYTCNGDRDNFESTGILD